MHFEPEVMLVGDSGVGKTTIFQRFETGQFLPGHEISRNCLGVMEHTKEWTVANQPVSVKLIGESYYDDDYYHPSVIQRVKLLLLVYSFDDVDSLQYICSIWHLHYYDTNVALVGNKCDLKEEERAVKSEQVQVVAENYDIDSDMVFEISAKTGQGFEEMFNNIALKIAALSSPQPPPSQVKISPVPPQPRKRCIIQ